MAFLETGAFVGLIAPGETTIIVGGVIAGQGEVELIPLIGLVWVCAVLGDTTSFFIGRRMGRDFMLRHGPRFKITEERLNQVEGYFERHGGKTILIGRFVGLIRAMAPFVIGSSGLPLPPLPALQHHRLRPLGHPVHGPRVHLLPLVRPGGARSPARPPSGSGSCVFVVAGVVLAYRRWGGRLMRPRGPQAALPGPAARRPATWASSSPPPWRSAGVGLYVFTLYTVLIDGGREFTPADRRLLDWPTTCARDWLTDVLEGGHRPRRAADRDRAVAARPRGAGHQAPLRRAGLAGGRRGRCCTSRST